MTTPTRFQFRLSSLLAVVTVCAVVLAAAKTLGFGLLLGFSGLVWSCGFILLLALALIPLDHTMARLPYWASFFTIPLLYSGLNFGFYISGEAIDMPHPAYCDGSNWFTHGTAHFFHDETIYIILAGMLIVVAIDAAFQKGVPKDHAYYPRLLNVWRSLGSLPAPLILIIGGLLVVGSYADSVISLWEATQRAGGLVWPPKRVFESCQILWGLIWLADCSSRPNRGTMAGAIGYLCLTALLLPAGGGVIE